MGIENNQWTNMSIPTIGEHYVCGPPRSEEVLDGAGRQPLDKDNTIVRSPGATTADHMGRRTSFQKQTLWDRSGVGTNSSSKPGMNRHGGMR